MADPTQPAPTFRVYDILSEVLEADPDYYEDEDVYEFSNGRKFKNTDRGGNGIYS